MIIGSGIGLPFNQKPKIGSPSDIGGLVFWVKADAGVLDASNNPITVNNTAVKTWQDFSGNNNHVTQSTVSLQPLYKTLAQNSLPTIQFDGLDDVMNLTSKVTTARTVFFVTKWTGGSVNDYRIIFGDPTDFYFHGDLGATGRLFYSDPNATTFPQIDAIYSGTKYVNKVLTAHNSVLRNTSFNVTTVKTTSNAAFSNFCNDRGFAGRGFYGQMAEIIVYNSLLSDADRGVVESYLMTKWGL